MCGDKTMQLNGSPKLQGHIKDDAERRFCGIRQSQSISLLQYIFAGFRNAIEFYGGWCIKFDLSLLFLPRLLPTTKPSQSEVNAILAEPNRGVQFDSDSVVQRARKFLFVVTYKTAAILWYHKKPVFRVGQFYLCEIWECKCKKSPSPICQRLSY